MAAPSTRWLCLLPLFLLLLLQGPRVAGQLTIGSADSFLPELLDANAVSTTGKTIEVTPLSDASVTNAAADAAVVAAADTAAAEIASDANSPAASEADDYSFTATDSPNEDTTLPDFDDYTVDETETTTKSASPENDVTEPGKADLPDYLADGEQGDGVTTASSELTRRIVFTGPDATATTPLAPLQSTRPSSVLRELSDPTTDLWRPNWPSHLLESTKEFRRPSVRFPTGPPPTVTLDTTQASPATTSPSYTVTKVPVTQYYFDLASVDPTAVPGPLFDRETVTASSSLVPSVVPDVTQPLEPGDLSSSISELQSSVLVDAVEPPVTSTPALPPSTTSLVITTEALQTISPSSTTETVPPTSTALNEVVEEHLDNTLTEESQTGGTAAKEITETSEVIPSGSSSTQSSLDIENSGSTTTTEDPDSLLSPVVMNETSQPTNISQPVTQSPTLPAPSTNSEPLTTTSSTPTGSVKPSSVRTSPAAKSSRIPLWQLLSQSSPSRPNSQPSSTPLTPSIAATLAADAVTPLSSAPPPLQSTSIEPPSALDESSPALAPSPSRNESTQEPVIPDESDPPTPLDIDDPDEVLTRAMKSETGSVAHNSTELPNLAPEPTESPLVDNPELNTNTEVSQNTTTQDSNVDTPSPASLDQHTSVDNTSNVEDVDNTLDGTHPNILPSSNTSENKTQHGNGIFDDPKVSDDEPLPIPAQDEKDPVVDPSEIPVALTPTVSVTWTPIVEETESVSVLTSTSPVPIATTVVSQTPPELLTGFTPIISTTHTIPVSHSELVPEGSATSASPASTVEFVDSTSTTSAPAQDLSTPSAPSSTLTASLAPTAVHKTDSESLDASSVTESVYQSVKKIDKILPPSDILPSTLFTSEREDTFAASQTPTFTRPLQTSTPEFLVPEVESTIVESLLESTVVATESFPSSPTFSVSDILPSPSETIVPTHTSLITHTNLSSVPPVSLSVPQSTVSPTFPEITVTSSPSRPHEVSKSLAFVFYPSLLDSTASPVTTDIPLSSPVPVLLDAPVSSNILDVPLSSGTPIPPEILVSSPVPVPLDVPVSSAVPVPLDAPVSSAVPDPSDVPVSSAAPVLPDIPETSAVPAPSDVPVPSTVPAPSDTPVSSTVPAFPDVLVSSVVPVLPDVTVSSAVPVPPDTYESSVTPDIVVSSAVPVPTEVPVSSITPMSTAVPILPDVPISSASVAILPTPSLRPTSDSPTLVVPTATDDPIPTLLPQPLHPEEGGEEETHEEMPGKEEAPESGMEPPPLPATTLPSPPLPDTTTTSSTTSSTSTTTTTTLEKVPETEAPTVKPTTAAAPDTTTAFTTAGPAMNRTTAAPGEMPMLTTTTVLDNGTEVVVALPYIRALVDYNDWEFCQRKHEFRSLFAEWITQDQNGSVKVVPKDIRFFAMADCLSFPSNRDDQHGNEDAGSHDATIQEKNHTHVYFYITNDGDVDRELTEKFPLFPTDLVISEELKYLVPRVMQLEVVRPDESSSQDQVQEAAVGTSVIVIIVICSIVGVTIIVALFFFMVVKRRGATNNYYGRRCTPVSMDAYSMDSVSVYHSFRRKSKRRASGRSMKSYLNQAFDDPNGPSRPLNFAKLTHFISDIDGVYEEFATIPVNMPKYDELPPGVEDKNRYANVIPVPETRVLLKVTKDGRNCEYINANFVRGARNESKYYIATQAPLDDTVADFWRMVWEQESRVVVMLTDFVEKGIDKCADYLPPSETLDCHRLYGDFQVTLKSRDMREKFVVSNVQLKNLENNLMREVAHMWFTGWPASGVPNEEGAFISFILEVRRTRKKLRAKGPIVVHCSPGTGRTGTLLASDIVMKQFEEHRTIDVPRTVYAIRRDRAGAVQTKEQYAFIYRVINLYASKLTSGNLESL